MQCEDHMKYNTYTVKFNYIIIIIVPFPQHSNSNRILLLGNIALGWHYHVDFDSVVVPD